MSELDEQVAARLSVLQDRIIRAGGVGVTVLPVTKTFPIDACWAAYRAGCSAVGENYAQEVIAKFGGPGAAELGPGGAERPFGVHFIGQLQTNKVRMLAPIITVYETVDRPSLVAELAKRVPGATVLVQADTTGEPGKGGCPIAEVPALVERAAAAGLEVVGLMTVGPTEGGPETARPGFRAVRGLADRLGLRVCSMGMTADLEVAVQEGATQVRVGSALFGARTVAAAPVR